MAMEDAIIISENQSSGSSPLNPVSRIICRVCQKQFSQYTCPRCNSRYCSLHCYKSHSLRCTELFMKENVMGELQQLQPDDETKRKMLDILKRFHEEEEDTDVMDEEDSTISEEIMEKILSGQIGFDALSAKEKKHFQRALASGELSKMIEPWDPWWLKSSAKALSLNSKGIPLVQPLLNQDIADKPVDDIHSDQVSVIPSGPEIPLPSTSKLSLTKPSPLLAIHLVDIIFSYCFTLRLYNGDSASDALESAMVVLSVSSVLGQGAQPETVSEALSHCLEQTCSPVFKQIGGLQFGLGLLDDVMSLLSLGRSGLICTLCDLQRLIQAAEKELKTNRSKKSKYEKIKSKLNQAQRKVYFIMCWVNEQPGEAWSSMIAIVNAEKCSAMEFESRRKLVKMEDKVERRVFFFGILDAHGRINTTSQLLAYSTTAKVRQMLANS